MKIEIFGSGCPNCLKLEANAREAAAAAGIEAEVVKVTSMDEIVARGILSTPGLAVDGVIKSTGKLLNAKQIKALLV